MVHDVSLSTPVRLRFAPSPTGYLHVGGARTALFNYLYTRAHNGIFVLRIEDTDQSRSTPEAVTQVIESLQWLGIDWDEGPIDISGNFHDQGHYGPYFQSQRLKIYQQHFEKLIQEKKVYHCFCSDKELNHKRKRMEAMGKPFVYDRKCMNLQTEEVKTLLSQNISHTLRFKVDIQDIVFEDQVKGFLKFDGNLIGDFVVRKSDGFPTYNFAVVVDDATMKITHIVRGDDHVSNTPRQILIYQALGYKLPLFAHISMILGHDGEKLSKRYGSVGVLEYREQGYYPDPFINFLALLGWSPKDGNEVITRENLKKSIAELKFTTSPAIFDFNKLNFLNGRYLRNLNATILHKDLRKVLIKSGIKNFPSNLEEILTVLKDYCDKLIDIVPIYQNFMKEKVDYVDSVRPWITGKKAKQLFDLASNMFSAPSSYYISPKEFQELISRAKQELGLKGKEFFMPLRVKLTGEEHGIEIDVLFRLKPRSVIVNRLKAWS